MASILGVNFNKIIIDKTGPIKGKLSIHNSVVVTDVKQGDVNIGAKKQPLLKVSFEFVSVYKPKVAKITLNGDLLAWEKPEVIKETVDGWKKSKKMPKEMMEKVLTTIIQKANIESLILSREVGLPPPVQLPKVKTK